MTIRSWLSRKWLHTVVLILLVAIILFGRGIVPQLEFVAAVGLIVAWLMGVSYERSIILEADLVDEDDLKQVERDRSTFFG